MDKNSVEYIRHALNYDQGTGLFTWRTPRPKCRVGEIAGHLGHCGYWFVCIDHKKHRAHRLAWFYMIGEFPDSEIDHINGIRSDNRWCNLRQASSSQNKCNAPKRSDNTSGFKGVSWSKYHKKWRSYIKLNGTRVFLGSFESRGAAYSAYVAASGEYHGQFAKIQ